MVGTAQQFRLLAGASARTFRSRAVELIRSSRLMTATLSLFMLGYLVIGYFLFARGLTFIHRLPGVGVILSERLLYMIFFFVFLMLVLSNAVVLYGSLFRSKETNWLLTLPIDRRVIFGWRVVESLFISSWGFMFICAPLLAAYGGLNGAGWIFYVKAVFLMIPFVAIPASIAAWLLLILARYANRSWWWGAGVLLVGGAGWSLYRYLFMERQLEELEANIIFALNQTLRHTRISLHPLVPSTWWTDALVQEVKHMTVSARFNALLLLSNALMAGLVTATLGGAAFARSLTQNLRHSADSMSRRRRRARARKQEAGPRPPALLAWLPRHHQALILKDLRGFSRDASQWVQVAVVFGLLLIYVLNIRNMGYDLENPFWTTVLTFLNITVCSLALSTLTTRFVFPQFSLEGQRLWVVGMAPFPLTTVLKQKVLLNVVLTGALTTTLMLFSGIMLSLPGWHIVFFVSMIILLSIGLNAIAVSLGALFPNLAESNPAKIVSGFGGTLCLITSFLYIVVFMATLIGISLASGIMKTNGPVPGTADGPMPAAVLSAAATPGAAGWGLALLATVAITFVFATIPWYFAWKRVKTLELLGKL